MLAAGLVIGLLGTAASLVGLFTSGPERFFHSYLFAYLFWIGLTLGSLAITMLHNLTAGRWGYLIRPQIEAASATIGLMALLFIPILLGLGWIYPWAHPSAAANGIWQYRSGYLNVPFFIIRAILYFAIWGGLIVLSNRWRTGEEVPGQLPATGRLIRLGAVGLILYVITLSFGVVDWLMSLAPEWTSTIYPLLIMIAQVLGALSLMLVLLPAMPWFKMPVITRLSPRTPYRDLGALLLTFVVLWAYLTASELIIIWQGNLPRDAAWYLGHSQGGWAYLVVLIVLVQFVLPFIALLYWRVRWNPRIVAFIGLVTLAVNLVYFFWQVIPAFYPGVFTMHWLDLAVVIGMGGLWSAAFAFALKRRPEGPRVEEAAVAEM
jgi:hypothetical protein